MDEGDGRRRRRKAARPGEIITAGLAEFAEKGFAGTRLEDVAKRAGIAKPTLYLYFPSKEALFEAAVRDRLGGLLDGLADSTVTFDGPTEALLRRLFGALYDRLVGTDVFVILKVLITEGGRFPQLVALYRELVLARGIALLGAIIGRGIARGEVRAGPAASEPRLLIAPTLMAALWTQLFGGPEPIERETFLAAQVDLVMHGLAR
jgi:AcrR family transcriptional regulator